VPIRRSGQPNRSADPLRLCGYSASGDVAALRESCCPQDALSATSCAQTAGWIGGHAAPSARVVKGELLDRQPWPAKAAARHAIVEYIGWYSGTRLRSTLGYRSPAEYAEENKIRKVA